MSDRLEAEFEKRYPSGTVIRAALNGRANRAETTVLFGPSGCGKSTILRCLAGLEKPETGFIRYGGETWFDAATKTFLRPQQRGIGFLFQDYALFPHLTVARNIGYGLHELPRTSRLQRVRELLERFHLDGTEDRFPHQLSGGQQQRVALARAVARRPRLLLLDEPLSALDGPTRDQLRGELRRTLADLGTNVILVTHDRIEAVSLADQVVVLDRGTILQSGPVDEVFSRPVNVAVARIVGVETVAAGRIVRVEDGLATVAVGSAEIVAVATHAVGSPVFVCIRAEEVVLQPQHAGGSSARNHLRGQVRSLIPEGPLVRVELDCGFPLAALVTRIASAELGLREGMTVTALVKAPAVHLIERNAVP